MRLTELLIDGRAHRSLIVLAGGTFMLYAVISLLSREFVFGEGFRERPILLVLLLFTFAFALYAASLRVALRCANDRRLAWLIVTAAILFRAVLLPSVPIQEIDIYRYLWDGAVASRGINPYRYAPAEIRDAASPQLPGNLQISPNESHLVRMVEESPSMPEVLRRIHYSELTTVYPPVSQAVFAIADRITPSAATLSTRVTIMKAVLLIFDVATVGLVWFLVRSANKHTGWVIAYAWCPLAIKEFSNSGHLDSVAVFFTTAALLAIARSAYRLPARDDWWRYLTAALLLGLAVGAKLYAVVLLPLLTAAIVRRCGRGRGFVFASLALVMSAVAVAPMFGTSLGGETELRSDSVSNPLMLPQVDSGNKVAVNPPAHTEPREGLTAFLSGWEMNDLLFLVVVENLAPVGDELSTTKPSPWFSIVPNRWRTRLIEPIEFAFSMEPDRAAFLLARLATSAVFLGIIVFVTWNAVRRNSMSDYLEAAFLTLAWFWLLSPTQNPWYWTWALPFLPFARGRAWFAVSGLVFAYYLRFWLLYHWQDGHVLNTPYAAAHFFDFVVPWIEFGPWFVWLAVAAAGRFLQTRRAKFGNLLRKCDRTHRVNAKRELI